MNFSTTSRQGPRFALPLWMLLLLFAGACFHDGNTAMGKTTTIICKAPVEIWPAKHVGKDGFQITNHASLAELDGFEYGGTDPSNSLSFFLDDAPKGMPLPDPLTVSGGRMRLAFDKEANQFYLTVSMKVAGEIPKKLIYGVIDFVEWHYTYGHAQGFTLYPKPYEVEADAVEFDYQIIKPKP